MRTFLVVSASPDPAMERRIAAGRSPRKDYIELSRATNGEIVYRDSVERRPLSRVAARLFGVPVGQAILTFLRRREYDAVFTDAENIGIPLAIMFKLAHVRRRHVMIGHRLTTLWKQRCFRLLKVQSHVDVIICHASLQRQFLERHLGVPASGIALLPYQVDQRFWYPMPTIPRRQVCSVGLEARDYRTLVEAARDLDLDVIINSSSFWSRRPHEAPKASLPPNVRLATADGTPRLGYDELRQLYADSLFAVVPLHDVDFQAGVTTILEAMAMGKAVIVSRARGQTDVVRDRPSAGLPADLAPAADATGRYVPPGDVQALKLAMAHLADHPQVAAVLGANGRQLVESQLTLDQFVARISALLRGQEPG